MHTTFYFRSVFRDSPFLLMVLISLSTILLLRFIFPLVSDYFYSEYGSSFYNYYSVVAITAVSVIPILLGYNSGKSMISDVHDQVDKRRRLFAGDKNEFSIIRNLFTLLLSFLILLLIAFITRPVPEEGWLRTVFIAGILSLQSPMSLLLRINLAKRRHLGFGLLFLLCIYLLVVPFGLLLHHPWNYFIFFSPLYWSSWAWVTTNPHESLYYGLISAGLTIVFMTILYRYLGRKPV